MRRATCTSIHLLINQNLVKKGLIESFEWRFAGGTERGPILFASWAVLCMR